MAITKAVLAQQIYENHDKITKVQATEAVEAFLRISKNTLINGSGLLLSGFGKFNIKEKNARKGRNPATGDEFILEERRIVTFKASGILKAKINESK
jgi:integration host factor subunit alpha